MLKGLRVLVTGASGFVGRHVLDAVSAAGGRPLPMVRKGSDIKGLEAWSHDFRHADLRDPEALKSAVSGADLVIHLAGLTRARSLEAFLAVNEEGVGALARACLDTDSGPRRFVLVSSASAAGPSGHGPPLTESSEPAPCSDYGRSKLAGERRLVDVLGDRLPWTIVRPPIVYGPHEQDMLALFRMCRRGIVPVLRRGKPPYSVVFGPDLAQALVALATHEGAVGETFFVCEEKPYAYSELVRTIGEAVGRVPWMPPIPLVGAWISAALGSLTQPLRKRDTLVSLGKLPEIVAPGWAVDAAKARTLLGTLCPTSLAEGTLQTAAWYREAGWL